MTGEIIKTKEARDLLGRLGVNVMVAGSYPDDCFVPNRDLNEAIAMVEHVGRQRDALLETLRAIHARAEQQPEPGESLAKIIFEQGGLARAAVRKCENGR